MKITRLMATITQPNGEHTDRRVYVDENERLFVKINRDFIGIFFLTTHGRKVQLWHN